MSARSPAWPVQTGGRVFGADDVTELTGVVRARSAASWIARGSFSVLDPGTPW